MKYVRSFVIVAFFLAILTGTVNAISAPKDVMVTDRGEISYYLTRVETVEEFFKENDIVIEEQDKLNVPLTEKILPGYVTKIVITRGLRLEVIIDGATEFMYAPQGTYAGTFIKQVEEKNGQEYVYAGKKSELLEEGQVIELTSATEEIVLEDVSVREEKVIEELAYDTVYMFDDQLLQGKVEIEQKGVMGLKEVTFTISEVDGEVIEKAVTGEAILSFPVTRIIKQGTKEHETKEVEIIEEHDMLGAVKKLVMNASAYTLNKSSTGKNPGSPGYGITASGMRAQHGIVAVDPNVIPLGTKLYIDGYGYAVAGDTGGSIKGNKIDLFYNTQNECVEFGRKDINVYILQDEE